MHQRHKMLGGFWMDLLVSTINICSTCCKLILNFLGFSEGFSAIVYQPGEGWGF